VQSYTTSPEPVSSRFIAENADLSVSSATVRNEMARLEDMGYITAPHTSAGRIPTALGYRYVVRDLMRDNELSLNEQQYIEHKFDDLPNVLEQWMRRAATVLARTAQTASLVTPPSSENNHFKHMQLISIQGRLALMVLVLQGGVVHQRMLNLAEPVQQKTLTETAGHINSICEGLTGTQIRMKSRHFDELPREAAELAADLMERGSTNRVRVVYRDGLSEIINAFPDSTGAQQAVRVFEERAFLDMILNEIIKPLMSDQDVQVVIAGDGHEEMSHLSLVLSRYGVPGQLGGTIGVLGPTHINYGRAISTVRHVSGLMTDKLVDLYNDALEPPDDSNSENP
jgi:heat-inducible transcriptional repressor